MPSSVDEVLAHAGVYDPAARRERYLQSRQLKGRAPGAQPDPGGGQSSGGSSIPAPALRTKANAAASNARQIAALKGRLSSLKAALQKLLADAGSSSSSSSSKSGSSSDKKDTKNEPQTAKQKAAAKEALKKAQKERAKEQKAEPDKPAEPSKEEKIAKLRATISDVESKLRAAIAGARNQTASNGR